MKRISLSFFLISVITISLGQTAPVVKGYAYQRVTFPGTRTTGISEETGAETQRTVKEKITWSVFLEHKPSVTIKPTLIWLRGTPYRVTYEKVNQNKVVVSRTTMNDRLTYDTLVKVTHNTIISMLPSMQSRISKTSAVSKKINNKNAVVEYYFKGKKYYYTIPVIKKLEPLALQ